MATAGAASPQLEVREGLRLECEAILDRRGRRAAERVSRLAQASLDPCEGPRQQPGFAQRVAVVALGHLELALPQAGSPPLPSRARRWRRRRVPRRPPAMRRSAQHGQGGDTGHSRFMGSPAPASRRGRLIVIQQTVSRLTSRTTCARESYEVPRNRRRPSPRSRIIAWV